jgi:hypothetical protein
MLNRYLGLLGLALVVFGIFGFIHPISPKHYVFHIYLVTVALSVIYMVLGLLSLAASFLGARMARWTALTVGVLFAGLTVYGFIIGTGQMLGFIDVNLADSILHLFVALITLYLGLTTLVMAQPRRGR